VSELRLVSGEFDRGTGFYYLVWQRNGALTETYVDAGNGKAYCFCNVYKHLGTCQHAFKAELLYDLCLLNKAIKNAGRGKGGESS
jgi:hypothetical protein